MAKCLSIVMSGLFLASAWIARGLDLEQARAITTEPLLTGGRGVDPIH
jgi:hypothetical protein